MILHLISHSLEFEYIKLIQNLMPPITEIADTLSFGLVGKIRRKTHIPENNVQIYHKMQKKGSSDIEICSNSSSRTSSISNSTSLPSFSHIDYNIHNNLSLANKLENENTITAAYVFENPTINLPMAVKSSENLKRAMTVPPTRSFSCNIINNNHRNSYSIGHNIATANPLEIVKPIFKKHSSESDHILNNKNKRSNSPKVKIADNAIDIISGEAIIKSGYSSKTLVSSLNNYNHSKKSIRSVQKNDFVSFYVPQEDDFDSENASILSHSDQQFKLVLDDHLIPGVPVE